MEPIDYMLYGGIATTSILVGMLFLRFWRTSHDRFFMFFALSFLLEGANRLVLGSSGLVNEDAPVYYLVRLLSYGLILVAILDKNIPRRKKTNS